LKNIFLFLAVLFTGMVSMQQASAQNCDGQRYFNTVFPLADSTQAYDSSTVVYSNDGMTMDLYLPHGDTATGRRSVLLIHGGNFYEGSSADPFIYAMCQLFVQKGYVVASINYHLISDTLVLQGVLLDSTTFYPILTRTISEGKAAVRYLKANAAALGIDSSWIVIGGESSGALIADHIAYVKSQAGVTPLLAAAFDSVGGLEGNSGNPGYSSKVKAVLNYGGALLDLNMLTPLDNEPIYTAQGDSDHNIPFQCGPLFDGYTDFTACGGGAIQPALISLGITTQLLMFDSLEYSPWADSTMALTGDTNHIALPQVQSQSVNFLYQVGCASYNGIRGINNVQAKLYPNPASAQLYIQADAAMESINVIDRLGRLIKTLPAMGTQSQIDVTSLSSGIYLARINLKENKGTVTRTFVVE
jgi:para-nitrobenzyl esterase